MMSVIKDRSFLTPLSLQKKTTLWTPLVRGQVSGVNPGPGRCQSCLLHYPPPTPAMSSPAREVSNTSTTQARTSSPRVEEVARGKPGDTHAPQDVRGTGRRKDETRKRKECVHNLRGVCQLHGPGALRKWRPAFISVTGSDGKMTRERTREYFWACDVGDRGVRRQTLLPFTRKTPEDTKRPQ